jgi:hypothetical protein
MLSPSASSTFATASPPCGPRRPGSRSLSGSCRKLANTLAQGPTGDLAFIVGENGKPLTKESFGNMFRAACNAAGVKKSAHGVRKIDATRAAEAGATMRELEALFGWTGGTIASLYTKTADRKRLAAAASEKIENAQRPHLPNSVRGNEEIS